MGALLVPDDNTLAHLRTASPGATRFVQCGGGRDAVVISPLQRGLAALDALDLPVEDGYSVFADPSRQELIVVVDEGWVHLWEDTPGVRVLSLSSWLLLPAPGGDSSYSAHWLSRPARDIPSLWRDQETDPLLGGMSARVDPRALLDALATVDKPVTAPVAAS
ncbi:hypothetical protein M2271_002460 [Streptomyces sp. LBL]|uniref:hypothetical protein n=1 Tax=Streptomyces sp. LBL TaxID=2940562 RepID=UPI002473D8E2|nr:hypothetical protein [Streptomyces sp. LBL]MDH6624656.1 hypothetical protein [Streptomyces sp. LBL]